MALTKISGNVIKDSVSLSGNVSVGGTLTYQDVSNVDAIGLITARSGINVQAGQLDVGNNIKIGNAGVITATSFVGSGANLTGLPSQVTISNNSDNRVITGGSGTNLNGEANLIFDGTKLGIGGNPDVDFHIKSAAPTIRFTDTDTNRFSQIYAVDGNLRFDADNSNAQADTNIIFRTDNSEKLRIASNGNIGIGNRTTSPDENLHVHTASGDCVLHVEAAADPKLRLRAHSGESIVQFADASSSNIGEINYVHSGDYLKFHVNGNERLRITSGGNVGINTSSVSIAGMSRYLSVSARNVTNGGSAVEIVGNRTGSDSTLGVINFVNNTSNVAQITAKYQGSTTRGSLQFFTSGAEKLRIDSSYARIGINTSIFDSAGSQLKIEGRGTGTTTAPMLQIKGVGNGVLHSYVDLVATSDNNAGTSYRGLGVVMHNEPTNVEWFAGRPYAASDAYIIGRKASPSYRTESGEAANQFLRIFPDGNVKKPQSSRFATRIDYSSQLESANVRLTFKSPHVNIGNDFSSSRYTAPIDGSYAFWFFTNVQRSGSGTFYATWYKSGSEVNSSSGGRMYDHYAGSGWINLSGCLMINLQQGEYIEVYNGGTAVNYDGNSYGQFMGWLVG